VLCEQATLVVTPGRLYSKRNCKYFTQQMCCVSINISEGEACLQAGDWGFDISMELQQGERIKERKKEKEK